MFPSKTSFRRSTPFVFLSERQPMAADFFPVLISFFELLNFLVYFGLLLFWMSNLESFRISEKFV